jgi:AcrR family transcriptional regulator
VRPDTGGPGEPLRSRGRPPAAAAADTRQLLISAARRRFAAEGFDRASLRSIAAEAGVDASLIRHYFGDKAGLLVATMQLPVNPAEILRSLIGEGPDGLGPRLVRGFLTAWDPHREVLAGLIRTTIAHAEAAPPALQVVQAVLLTTLREVLPGSEPEQRAELIVGQLLGLAIMRYVLHLDPLATAPLESVVADYGPAIQRLVDGPGPR